MSVTRYDVNGPSSVFEDVNGSLVDYKDYAALEAKCAALAAENAGLKALIPENWQMHDALHQLIVARPGGVYFNKWEKLIVGVLNATPATEAFLAEVRAQGVEMMASEAEQLMDEFGDDSYIVMVTADLQRFANAFAAQLRKGVQS